MKELKKQWIDLNGKYDRLMLDILNGKEFDLAQMKERQDNLFKLENEIYNL